MRRHAREEDSFKTEGIKAYSSHALAPRKRIQTRQDKTRYDKHRQPQKNTVIKTISKQTNKREREKEKDIIASLSNTDHTITNNIPETQQANRTFRLYTKAILPTSCTSNKTFLDSSSPLAIQQQTHSLLLRTSRPLRRARSPLGRTNRSPLRLSRTSRPLRWARSPLGRTNAPRLCLARADGASFGRGFGGRLLD